MRELADKSHSVEKTRRGRIPSSEGKARTCPLHAMLGCSISLVHEIQTSDITWIPAALLSLQIHRALFHLLQDVL